jgi:hypothetical protein
MVFMKKKLLLKMLIGLLALGITACGDPPGWEAIDGGDTGGSNPVSGGSVPAELIGRWGMVVMEGFDLDSSSDLTFKASQAIMNDVPEVPIAVSVSGNRITFFVDGINVGVATYSISAGVLMFTSLDDDSQPLKFMGSALEEYSPFTKQ